MTGVKYGVVVRRPRDMCMLTEENVSSVRIPHGRSLRKTNIGRISLLEISRNNIASNSDESNIAQEERKENGEELAKSIFNQHGPRF